MMQNNERRAFGELIGGMAATYGIELSALRLEGYWLGLSDLSFEALERAVPIAVRSQRFFPTVAELRVAAGEIDPDVGLVWEMLIGYLRRTVGLPSEAPGGEYLSLVIQRMGGRHAIEGMDDERRLHLLRQIVPGVTAAARARGMAMPNALPGPEAFRAQIGSAPRAQIAQTPEMSHEEASEALARVIAALPKPAEPSTHSPMTPEDEEARRALLRAQARRLLEEG